MKSTINSILLLIKILWHISNRNQKLKTFLIVITSVLSSLLQYINIVLTAITFSFITSLAYSEKNSLDIDLLFGNKIQLEADSFLNLIFVWIVSSFITYLSIIFSSISMYRLAYFFGKKLSNKVLDISIKSNSLFFENISEKTLFNLMTSENTLLIKGPILSLVTLPIHLSTIIALVTIIFQYSFSLVLVLPFIALLYFLISNLLFKSVSQKGEKIFDLRSYQTDLLSRIIDNYLDVKFPPSDKAYKNLFYKTTNNLGNFESFVATIPKVLKAILELILILIVGLYVFYSISILNLPIEYFVSSSAAVILSLLKLTPVLSGISSNFLSFNAQYESIKNYSKILFNNDKYNLFSNQLNYSKIIYGKEYELKIKDLSNSRINKYRNSKSLSLNLKHKKLLWITGKSGCGKSTFLSIVAGTRPINKGSIELSINNKRSNKSLSIHEKVAYMPQKPTFHSITVLEYIKDGDENLNLSRMIRILDKLKLSNSFEMSNKNLLKLIIGPRGYSPSGGQSKLLAFARALYKKDVFLYLFDEPTSELSGDLKIIILNTIYALSEEKFIFCITHDKKAIRSFDNELRL